MTGSTRFESIEKRERGPEPIDTTLSDINLAYAIATSLSKVRPYPGSYMGEGAPIPQTDGKITDWGSLED